MISIDDIVVELAGTRILDGVSATVAEGAFVGLVGPNGAGKTTLLRTITAAITPTSGSVTVDGEDIHSLSSRAASRLVATVPQTTTLSFDFSVRQAVEMGRTPHRSRFGSWRPDDRDAVDRAMAQTEIEALSERSVMAISGGERQRVLIARALAQSTPVVLLDEPTASLDINHQVRTLELVRSLVREGKTAMAAIHDLNLAAHYCDRLVLLSNQSVIAAGPPEAVLTEARLREAFDANAVVSRHPVTGSVYVTALPDRTGTAVGRVHVVGGGGSAARLLYVLSAAGYTVTAGALNEGDTDTETARHLGIDIVTVPPYAGVDDAAQTAVADHVAAADVVVVADIEVSEGNRPNLVAAADADELVVVEERPFETRNFDGEDGRAAYDRLQQRGTVVGEQGVLRAVEAALGEKPKAESAVDDGSWTTVEESTGSNGSSESTSTRYSSSPPNES